MSTPAPLPTLADVGFPPLKLAQFDQRDVDLLKLSAGACILINAQRPFVAAWFFNIEGARDVSRERYGAEFSTVIICGSLT